MDITIRNETKKDYREVEVLTRESFWNLYIPGCNEHYLAHTIRHHPDFISKLTFVAVYKNKIVGSIMYTKSFLFDANDSEHKLNTLTFGPLCVLPKFQKKGIGSQLIKHSIKKARESEYKVIIIQGDPNNYCKHGFKSAKDLKISDSDGKFPYSLLALELENKVLKKYNWKYFSSPVYNINEDEANEFDKSFEYKEKRFEYTQVAFSIACRAYIL